MNRRKFAKKTILASAVVSVNSLPGISNFLPVSARNIKKSIMWSCIEAGNTIAEKFQLARQAGFEGVELLSHFNRKEVLKARDATGLVIPSVCDAEHWNFLLSDPDPSIREKGVEALKIALEDANTYGADTVLLVPGRVTESVSYDECWKRTVEEIKKAIPTAEKLKVTIAIENVWNGFLLSPLEAANYIDQFRHPLIRFYFDCGNVVNYGWPEQWIKILGTRIAKVHIKEFSRKLADTKGKAAGFGVKLTEGDVNWPAVMRAFDDTGYHGWATIEQDGGDSAEALKDLSDRLITILGST
jgi:L-ribulose-5-phosphate 3-epimerase